MDERFTFDEIVDALDRHRQRATYGAVAAYVGSPAAFLMNGIHRAPRYSWIVNQETRLPTGYTKDEMHSDLARETMVLTSELNLDSWLRANAARS